MTIFMNFMTIVMNFMTIVDIMIIINFGFGFITIDMAIISNLVVGIMIIECYFDYYFMMCLMKDKDFANNVNFPFNLCNYYFN